MFQSTYSHLRPRVKWPLEDLSRRRDNSISRIIDTAFHGADFMHALDWIKRIEAVSDPAGLRRLRQRHLPDPRVDQRRSCGPSFPEADGEAAISRFPGPQTDLADMLDELFTLPFFSKRRLVIVEDADTFVTKHRKDLEAYVEKPSASGILVLQVKQWTSTTRLAKLVDEGGAAHRLRRPA